MSFMQGYREKMKIFYYVKGLALLSLLLLGSLALWCIAAWCIHKLMRWVGVW